MKYLLSILYLFLIKIRYVLYERAFFKIIKFKTPIISVGNIEVGGTGKTPMTILLSNKLSSMNIKHAIISRGYKKESLGLMVVSDYKRTYNLSTKQCGDEPLLLAKKLPGVPIIVSEDKVAAIHKTIKNYKPQILILDDGFQSIKISSTLNIVLINSLSAKSSFRLFPLGNLREPVSSLKRADIVVFTKTNIQKPSNFLINQVSSNFQGPIINAKYHSQLLCYNIKKNDMTIMVSSNIHNAILLSGIGDSSSFLKLAKLYAKNILLELALPDHYNYSENANFIKKKLDNQQLKTNSISLIVTYKDFIKIQELLSSSYSFILQNNIPLYIIDINHEINDDRTLIKKLNSIINMEF